jgi:hypothetical protein
MAVGIFVPATGAGFRAQFIGTCTANGVATILEWSGSGDDDKAVARMEHHRAAGAHEFPVTLAGLADCTLLGPVPTGDMDHEWTGGEFFRVIDGA